MAGYLGLNLGEVYQRPTVYSIAPRRDWSFVLNRIPGRLSKGSGLPLVPKTLRESTTTSLGADSTTQVPPTQSTSRLGAESNTWRPGTVSTTSLGPDYTTQAPRTPPHQAYGTFDCLPSDTRPDDLDGCSGYCFDGNPDLLLVLSAPSMFGSQWFMCSLSPAASLDCDESGGEFTITPAHFGQLPQQPSQYHQGIAMPDVIPASGDPIFDSTTPDDPTPNDPVSDMPTLDGPISYFTAPDDPVSNIPPSDDPVFDILTSDDPVSYFTASDDPSSACSAGSDHLFKKPSLPDVFLDKFEEESRTSQLDELFQLPTSVAQSCYAGLGTVGTPVPTPRSKGLQAFDSVDSKLSAVKHKGHKPPESCITKLLKFCKEGGFNVGDLGLRLRLLGLLLVALSFLLECFSSGPYAEGYPVFVCLPAAVAILLVRVK
eukprot:gene8554-33987_t